MSLKSDSLPLTNQMTVLQVTNIVWDIRCLCFTCMFPWWHAGCLLCAESPNLIAALCFSRQDGSLLVGYESGLLELWQNNRVVGHKQVKKGTRNRDLNWTRLLLFVSNRTWRVCPCVSGFRQHHYSDLLHARPPVCCWLHEMPRWCVEADVESTTQQCEVRIYFTQHFTLAECC